MSREKSSDIGWYVFYCAADGRRQTQGVFTASPCPWPASFGLDTNGTGNWSSWQSALSHQAPPPLRPHTPFNLNFAMMLSRTLLVSTIAFAAAQSSDQAMFDTMFGYIMPMIDGDNNNKVTHTEMDMMMTLLNIPQTELDSMCMRMSNPISPCNSAGLVTRYDADNDGELSFSEILTLAQQNQQVGPILIARVTGSGISSGGGGGGSDPMAEIAQSITTVPDGIKTASEKLETTLTVSGNRIWPGQREQVKDYFSTLWGIPKADIVLTVEPSTSSGRRLSALTTSWDIKATGFFANAADVSAAQTATEAALPDAAAADAALPFVSVTSAPTTTTTSVAGVMPLPIASFALVVIPLLGGLLSITGACCMTCSKKEKEPVGGCCGCACTQTGCCSVLCPSRRGRSSSSSALSSSLSASSSSSST